jgi:predicted alpha/beta superfamily hydrolase
MEKHSFELWSPQLRNHRTVDVYLPASYGEGRRRYPIVYMQDGQNLSDPAVAFGGSTWRLEDGLHWLAQRGTEAIVVGLWNTPGRLAEYSPFADPKHGGGDGDKYLRFLIDTVKPRIDGEFRTRKDRDSTVIGGSSMGGLISLYGFFRRPSPFGRALVMSPSIWFGAGEILRQVSRARSTRGKIYLDVGTAEGTQTVKNTRVMNRLLRKKGYRRENLWYIESEGARHSESDWAWRWPQALEFLLRDR